MRLQGLNPHSPPPHLILSSTREAARGGYSLDREEKPRPASPHLTPTAPTPAKSQRQGWACGDGRRALPRLQASLLLKLLAGTYS